MNIYANLLAEKRQQDDVIGNFFLQYLSGSKFEFYFGVKNLIEFFWNSKKH